MMSGRGKGTCHLVSCLAMVTRAFVGGAAESETGVGSLSSDFTRDRPTSI